MADIVQNIINHTLSDGARASKYKVQIVPPEKLDLDGNVIDVLCKSTSLPTITNEPIKLKYKGRIVPIPGQETYNHTLDLTFYLEENHSNRNKFIAWLLASNDDLYTDAENLSTNYTEVNANVKKDNNNLYGTIHIEQINFDATDITSRYIFHKCFVQSISSVSLDASATGTLLEYTVSFSYLYFDSISLVEETDTATVIMDKIQDTFTGIVKGAIGHIPGLDTLNIKASEANESIQNAGKAIGTTMDNWVTITQKED